mmetsp:Transcript_13437/g.19883  ORF Transcript_13437/g.19883 Transcript_13437/m.19883 type:complete len:235 (-) Transcript_13437:31-735(-)
MTKADASDVGNDNVPAVNVKSVAIDDIIQNKVGPTIDYAESNRRSADGKIDKLFLLKVDKQGHEPSVFSGLRQSIREHKIDFIITEYWPKGIDFMNDTMGPETECQKSIEMMQLMIDAGYDLYTMSVTSHAKAPHNRAREAIHTHNHPLKPKIQTPIDILRAHCIWFYDSVSHNSLVAHLGITDGCELVLGLFGQPLHPSVGVPSGKGLSKRSSHLDLSELFFDNGLDRTADNF